MDLRKKLQELIDSDLNESDLLHVINELTSKHSNLEYYRRDERLKSFKEKFFKEEQRELDSYTCNAIIKKD